VRAWRLSWLTVRVTGGSAWSNGLGKGTFIYLGET
jgi:hypothetical protein